MDVDPLAGKADAGQKRLHDGAGDAKKRHGTESHGDDEERFVMICLFHGNHLNKEQIWLFFVS